MHTFESLEPVNTFGHMKGKLREQTEVRLLISLFENRELVLDSQVGPTYHTGLSRARGRQRRAPERWQWERPWPNADGFENRGKARSQGVQTASGSWTGQGDTRSPWESCRHRRWPSQTQLRLLNYQLSVLEAVKFVVTQGSGRKPCPQNVLLTL